MPTDATRLPQILLAAHIRQAGKGPRHDPMPQCGQEVYCFISFTFRDPDDGVCHVFAAGYDIRTPETYAETMAAFDETVGLDKIKCFHLNDSKHELGSNKDRHEHIGEGFIGKSGFANFVNDSRWANHPAHLETPKTEEDEDGNEIEMDPVNLKTLRDLIE